MPRRVVRKNSRSLNVAALLVAILGGVLGIGLLVAVLTTKPQTVSAPARAARVARPMALVELSPPPEAVEAQTANAPRGELSHLDAVLALKNIAGDAPIRSVQHAARRTLDTGGLLVWPTGVTELSSGFGYRTNPLSGDGFQLHRGLDVRASCGSEVVAAASGVVSFADWTDSSGNTIKIAHAKGLNTRYAHLSSLRVNPGDHVNAGEIIGYSGDTGRLSTGAHLHFEVWKNGEPINPLIYRFHHLPAGSLARNTSAVCNNTGGGAYTPGPAMAMGSADGDAFDDMYAAMVR